MPVVIAVLLAAAFLSSVCPAQQTTLIEFEIADQFDEPHTEAEVRGNAVLFVGSDKNGSRYQGAWMDRLRAMLQDRDAGNKIRIIESADLRGVPFFVKGSVKKKFPRDRRSWVLMDWKGKFAKTYRFEKHKCNILLFDHSGTLVFKGAAQEPNPGMLARVGDAIDALPGVTEASNGSRPPVVRAAAPASR